MQYPEPIAKLIDSFQKLPGIGAKTAARLAFFVLDMPEADVVDFAKALVDVKRNLVYCSICGNITEEDPCVLCADQSRDRSQVMVVEQARDVMSMERMQEYRGLYHVLHGVLSPMEGTGPEDLNITSLLTRLQDETIQEVIIATNATAEGEATATYLSRLIQPAGIKVSRIAYGLSVGSDIEYVDEMTLLRALEGRRTMNQGKEKD
ncbi:MULTISPECIES: recombination mediator RecR [Aerococcus]|uniref:Recombination protein RecR n=1 Tax=Aerococcus sanguinicola TaxID=119206 RepID=A0A5N1GJZ5_9LACT|nr:MULTISPECIES: recombination mediator RecR [Aerococcus]KAA9300618.1 recombination protein RecR [Aerococcus sanguinicola]MDK6369579.1 recombination mediator RecR [Aerococcus sp. UMB9870]MDK6680084.1 recombination mediator RecR [Aerococcus sp. UMB8608]MDK6686245.1 recombination mediator RecR [Aerococcus sp. UMB8623]MDK6940164.1 recombination mediator RecR [Aerococcus sp. UMB8487]